MALSAHTSLTGRDTAAPTHIRKAQFIYMFHLTVFHHSFPFHFVRRALFLESKCTCTAPSTHTHPEVYFRIKNYRRQLCAAHRRWPGGFIFHFRPQRAIVAYFNSRHKYCTRFFFVFVLGDACARRASRAIYLFCEYFILNSDDSNGKRRKMARTRKAVCMITPSTVLMKHLP